MESVDIGDLNSPDSNVVRVRVPPSVPQSMNLRSIVRDLRRLLAYNEPLITVSISRENLLHNLRTYQETYPGLAIAPVLKSNAYGHGLCVVAEVLDRENIAFFMVDSLYEAKQLRKGGIRSRIVVMGYVRPEYLMDNAVSRTDYALTDIEQLRELVEHAHKTVRVHIKLDTGMHRNGIMPEDLPEAIRLLSKNSHVVVVGVATHLADADGTDTTFSLQQLSAWTTAVETLTQTFPTLIYKHAAATKGVRFAPNAPMTVTRVGMGLYGYDTALEGNLPLRPVLEMRSCITSLRDIPAGDHIGYNGTFVAKRPSRIATVPIGYFEGIDRRLSGVGSFLVRGQSCPLAGRVSMNMTSLDVTDVPEVARDDVVTAISRDPGAPNSIRALATLSDTTPYVLLAHIPQHLKRIIE